MELEQSKIECVLRIFLTLAGADGWRSEDEVAFIKTKMRFLIAFGRESKQIFRSETIDQVLSEIGVDQPPPVRKENCRTIFKAAAVKFAKMASKEEKFGVYAHALDLCLCDGHLDPSERELLDYYQAACELDASEVSTIDRILRNYMHFNCAVEG